MKIMHTFTLFSIPLLCFAAGETLENYDTRESPATVFNTTNTISSRQAGYGLIRFEGQSDPLSDQHEYGLVTFEGETADPLKFENQNDNFENSKPVKFEQEPINSIYSQNLPDDLEGEPIYNQNTGANQPGYGLVAYQDDNRIEDEQTKPVVQKKKRRRRRRKPRGQRLPNLPTQGYGFGYPGSQGPITFPGSPVPANALPGPQGGIPNPYVNPTFSGQFYRPPRRPRPSPTSDALTAVTGALTSIARYDDYQCVPRMLCEAAGGGALGSAGILQSVAGLQPLLTLLSAYNGISTSPLFVFGRAAFLGMTSKGNTGTCRYAYPQCPTDPEQLVHYLNNHNGGFFRFFNAPQQNPQQNLEQFYNQLAAGQHYGYYQNPGPQNQNYGINQNIDHQNQNYGLYQSPETQGQNYGIYQNQFGQQNHGAYSGHNQGDFQNPGPYGSQQSYGFNYPHGQGNAFNVVKFKNREEFKNDGDNKIEKRIQNKPDAVYVDTSISNANYDNTNANFDDLNPGFVYVNPNTDVNSKWSFPEDKTNINNDIREGKTLKFPENTQKVALDKDLDKKAKGFLFPGVQSNRQYNNYYNNDNIYYTDNNDKYVYYNALNANKYNSFHSTNNVEDEDVRTVYIVRGDGDPNNPEIVKLKPGETLR